MQLTFDTGRDDLEEVQRVLDVLRGATSPDRQPVVVSNSLEGNAPTTVTVGGLPGDGSVVTPPETPTQVEEVSTPLVAAPSKKDVLGGIGEQLSSNPEIYEAVRGLLNSVSEVTPPAPPCKEPESDPATLFVGAQGMQAPSELQPPTPQMHWSSLMPTRRMIPWDPRIHAGTKTTTAKGAWKMKPGVDKALALSIEQELSGEPQGESTAHPVQDYNSLAKAVSAIIRGTGVSTTMTKVAIPLAKEMLDAAGLDSSQTILGFEAKNVPVELMRQYHDELEELCQKPTQS